MSDVRVGVKGAMFFPLKSPVEYEERMRTGHWLGSVFWVSFSALTLLVGWHGRTSGPQKNLCHLPQGFSSGISGGKNWGDQITQVHAKEKWRWCCVDVLESVYSVSRKKGRLFEWLLEKLATVKLRYNGLGYNKTRLIQTFFWSWLRLY